MYKNLKPIYRWLSAYWSGIGLFRFGKLQLRLQRPLTSKFVTNIHFHFPNWNIYQDQCKVSFALIGNSHRCTTGTFKQQLLSITFMFYFISCCYDKLPKQKHFKGECFVLFVLLCFLHVQITGCHCKKSMKQKLEAANDIESTIKSRGQWLLEWMLVFN